MYYVYSLHGTNKWKRVTKFKFSREQQVDRLLFARDSNKHVDQQSPFSSFRHAKTVEQRTCPVRSRHRHNVCTQLPSLNDRLHALSASVSDHSESTLSMQRHMHQGQSQEFLSRGLYVHGVWDKIFHRNTAVGRWSVAFLRGTCEAMTPEFGFAPRLPPLFTH